MEIRSFKSKELSHIASAESSLLLPGKGLIWGENKHIFYDYGHSKQFLAL